MKGTITWTTREGYYAAGQNYTIVCNYGYKVGSGGVVWKCENKAGYGEWTGNKCEGEAKFQSTWLECAAY